MENFSKFRKIIRESLEQSTIGDKINVESATNLISEKVEAADKKNRIAVLMEERKKLLNQLDIKDQASTDNEANKGSL